MHIVFAAPECVPYAKTGGVADVMGALPREIARQGHRTTVYMPLYRQAQKYLKETKVAIESLTIPFPSYNRFVRVVDGGVSEGVQLYFIDCPELFDREYLYETPSAEYADNAERFGLFSRAVLESSKRLGVPDLFHVHGWPPAALAILLRTVYYFDPVLKNVACLLTIHNADRQGRFSSKTVEQLLLPWDVYQPEGVEFYDSFNFLKGGIVYSDAITTVSRKYAEELRTPEFGNGLDPVLGKRAADLYGILNGVDYREWNPATDSKIAAHYNAERLEGKLSCRKDLLHAFGVSSVAETTPVVGMVGHLSTQKGLDLMAQIADQLAQGNMLLLVLGMGESYYENLLRGLAERYPSKIAVRIAYDETLAHKIEAGSDIILMPSRSEPCGLNQIYGLKYGTVPVVRATGGLDDTVQEWDAEAGTGTGFKFHGYQPEDLLNTLWRAFGVFADKEQWRKLMRNGMACDYSWTNPAREYIRIYEELVRRRS
ncbi:MAG TPA: glycogen synthase GlgA [Acidobacteriaceae bacterium]|nr:glycogen synthase GlgA [Acidobacteriaceae bacterium]